MFIVRDAVECRFGQRFIERHELKPEAGDPFGGGVRGKSPFRLAVGDQVG